MSSSHQYESVSNAPQTSRYANCCLACGVCKILCYTVCCKTCHSATSPREELTLLCLGLEGAGKSTLLATLAGETVTEEVQPTLGFSIKAVVTQRAVFNVKELGGGEMIRQYWERYFSGHNGLMFVIDSSSCDEVLDESVSCLSRCLTSPALQDHPLLVVCSKQDKSSNNTVEKVEAKVKSVMNGRQWSIAGSGPSNVEAVKKELENMANYIIDQN